MREKIDEARKAKVMATAKVKAKAAEEISRLRVEFREHVGFSVTGTQASDAAYMKKRIEAAKKAEAQKAEVKANEVDAEDISQLRVEFRESVGFFARGAAANNIAYMREKIDEARKAKVMATAKAKATTTAKACAKPRAEIQTNADASVEIAQLRIAYKEHVGSVASSVLANDSTQMRKLSLIHI